MPPGDNTAGVVCARFDTRGELYIEDIYFFEVNTKYIDISSLVLKISAISHVLDCVKNFSNFTSAQNE